MEDFSKRNLRKHCPNCDPKSYAFRHPLFQTNNFFIVCDVFPIIEGHLLIIPKDHVSCIGQYSSELYSEFFKLYQQLSHFLLKEYQFLSTFEHGKFGQTVYHSHIHLLPYKGSPFEIIPEGESNLNKFDDLSELKKIYQKDGGYLFFSIGNDQWIVDKTLTAPRFFRDRFANALGRPERGNWKKMSKNKDLLKIADKENKNTKKRWIKYLDTPQKNHPESAVRKLKNGIF